MTLPNKPLAQITKEDLLNLITNGEAEGKYLDYKRDGIGPSDTDKKEFLYDISSFANAGGGHIIFGVDEQKGIATELIGIAIPDTDAEILRLESIARNGIRPPIAGLESVAVPLADGKVAIIVQIPKSWTPPHQVIYKGAYRFYSRNTNSKYPLEADELKSIIMLSENGAEKLKLFRIERTSKIIANEASAPLESGAKTITHILPLSAFTTGNQIDLSTLYNDPQHMIRICGGGGTTRYNVDGFIQSSRRGEPSSGYAQVFRNGCIEIVDGFSTDSANRKMMPSTALEKRIIFQIQNGKQLLRTLGGQAPIVVMVTLIGVKDWQMAVRPEIFGSVDTFDRDPLFIPEILIQTFDGSLDTEVRPLLDSIWNAAGWLGSINFDDAGNWTGHAR